MEKKEMTLMMNQMMKSRQQFKTLLETLIQSLLKKGVNLLNQMISYCLKLQVKVHLEKYFKFNIKKQEKFMQ